MGITCWRTKMERSIRCANLRKATEHQQPSVNEKPQDALRPTFRNCFYRSLVPFSRRAIGKLPTGSCSPSSCQFWILRVVLRQLIEQNHVEQRPMNLDAAVVADETEFAKAIHEEADTGTSGSYHFC